MRAQDLQKLVETPRGRNYLIAYIAKNEEQAVPRLASLVKEIPDDGLRRMAAAHMVDEFHHFQRLRGCLTEFVDVESSMVGDLFDEIRPETLSEKYFVLMLLEERGRTEYANFADAIRPHDERTARILDSIGKDEERHIRICETISERLGGRLTEEKIRLYKEVEEYMAREGDQQVVVYEPEAHFSEISSWDVPLIPELLGSGLVIPGICCGFVDGIGSTKTAFFYGLRANPELPTIARSRSILKLGARLIEAAKSAGFVRGLTATSHEGVEHFWMARRGFKRDGTNVLMGVL